MSSRKRGARKKEEEVGATQPEDTYSRNEGPTREEFRADQRLGDPGSISFSIMNKRKHNTAFDTAISESKYRRQPQRGRGDVRGH